MKTVFVGLSGGVDSAVSAYLLKKQGYRVVGAFIKAWEPDFLPCTGAEDRLSAMRVAAHLGIPFVAYDLSEEYKQNVVDYFVEEYKAGRTPNPDVMCNRIIKFGAFWKKANADGADLIATGHYAVKEETKEGEWSMGVSADDNKDQTYFLWTLTQDDLSHTLFPIGDMKKSEVRNRALEADLPNAVRKDSQGLCFLGHVDMTEFLKRYIPAERGVVRDESGLVLGEHDGAVFYTLGQRVSVGGLQERRYVVAKNLEKNELVVSMRPLGEHPAREVRLSQVNWIPGNPPQGKLLARYRYRQPLIGASVANDKVLFDEAQLVAPGQSIVFYDTGGGRCLGGGVASVI